VAEKTENETVGINVFFRNRRSPCDKKESPFELANALLSWLYTMKDRIDNILSFNDLNQKWWSLEVFQRKACWPVFIR